MEQVVPLARAFSNAGEHRIPPVAAGDVVDEFRQNHRLPDARAAEQPQLAAPRERADEVHHLDARLQHLVRRDLVRVCRRFPVDRQQRRILGHRTLPVDRVSDDVEQASEGILPNGHLNRQSGIRHRGAPGEPVGRIHGHTPRQVFAQMLLYLQHEAAAAVARYIQCVVYGRQFPAAEIHVHHNAHDFLDYAFVHVETFQKKRSAFSHQQSA